MQIATSRSMCGALEESMPRLRPLPRQRSRGELVSRRWPVGRRGGYRRRREEARAVAIRSATTELAGERGTGGDRTACGQPGVRRGRAHRSSGHHVSPSGPPGGGVRGWSPWTSVPGTYAPHNGKSTTPPKCSRCGHFCPHLGVPGLASVRLAHAPRPGRGERGDPCRRSGSTRCDPPPCPGPSRRGRGRRSAGATRRPAS